VPAAAWTQVRDEVEQGRFTVTPFQMVQTLPGALHVGGVREPAAHQHQASIMSCKHTSG
jgi:hypothetical protein